MPRWFQRDEGFDKEIAEKFLSLVAQARSSQLDSWAQKPQGTLALILLLDQFPRNIFRGTAESFATDTKAFDIATRAISQGLDREMSPIQQMFFYMPLEHSEQLISQVAAISLFEGLAHRAEAGTGEEKVAQQALGYAQKHKDVIERFGRFPSKNEILKRSSTQEEINFLKDNPSGL
jgi:uncharacterized protein (DUF924 family)